ncbi:Guanine nucleotide-binding-like protein 1 [Halocaridina rubra]|uniref:Guanine nucleotide-binding protein-like 1 n=1 Tax=Halocaridina rubra TaxID=373956 RepID=A0AAN8X6V2_HALRR
MPQNRRKVAFSGKKKKEQIQAHRKRKAQRHAEEDNESCGNQYEEKQFYGESSLATPLQDSSGYFHRDVQAVNQQPGGNSRANRYNLKFRKATSAEKEKRKALHSRPVEMLPDLELENDIECFYPPGLSYPSRPPWKKNMTKSELDMSENRYFRLFCEQIDKNFADRDLSLYELNLETWRQLWRVTEMSDILLVIVDARFPVALFPPYLYHHLVEKENKGVILIMNKCDLLPASVVLAWERYFCEKFPKLLVVPFSSMEGKKSKKSLLRMAAESALSLVDACQKLVDGEVSLDSWRSKIEEERNSENEINETEGCEVAETQIITAQSTVPEIYHRFRDGILTLGTIGHPNVGKSSLINALMGKKVVSVSKTPGHTKHFQTIFLTKNIKLCDCPGLVFPSTVDMPLQVLLGSFPIAQVRDPISIAHYIAQRLDVPRILKLSQLEDMDNSEWTSYFICKAWAEKRGYHTRSRGVADVSRAANELLRFSLNGFKSLIIYLRPPGFTQEKKNIEADPCIERIRLIQGTHASDTLQNEEEEINLEKEETSQNASSSDGEDSAPEAASEDEKEEKEECEEENKPSVAYQNKYALLDCD